MGYKGHPGWSDADVGNVPPENPKIPCDECGETKRVNSIKGEWRWEWVGEYEQAVYCSECQDGTEDGTV